MALACGSDGFGHKLFLFSGGDQVLTPIEPLIANPEGWRFDLLQTREMVAAIGNDGVVYGSAHLDGERHAFKLVTSAD